VGITFVVAWATGLFESLGRLVMVVEACELASFVCSLVTGNGNHDNGLLVRLAFKRIASVSSNLGSSLSLLLTGDRDTFSKVCASGRAVTCHDLDPHLLPCLSDSLRCRLLSNLLR
jgi:hypothetical protein